MRERLDIVLVERGLSESRAKAKLAVLEGRVLINGHLAHKPSDWVTPLDELSVSVPEKFVSRGGLKLEHALNCFALPLENVIALDIGASTGGFTDCLLQRGVKRVFAIDVGQGQLAWKLRQDQRVVVMERVNARFLTKAHFSDTGVEFNGADLIVVDCSFISLRLIVPPVLAFLKPGGKIVALIKPQFEAGRDEVSRGRGVIRDAEIHERVIDQLREFCGTLPGVVWEQVVASPILGPAGNKEFLVLLSLTDLEQKNEHRNNC